MKKLGIFLFLVFWFSPALAGMNVISGNVSHRQMLFATPGGPLPLEIGLSYNSLDRLDGALGVGWNHSYDIYLHQNSDGTMVLTGGVDKRFYFVDGGGYKARTGDFSALVHNGDDTWSITLRSGLQYHFGTDKKLTAVVDRYGNTVTVDNTVADQTTVTDPAGRSAVIHYSGGKITSITDPAQKQYDFTYDANGLLWKVQYPEPAAGAGRPTWEYTYTATDSLLEYVKDAEGHITKYGYTGGLVSRMVDPDGVIDMNGAETADVAQHTKTLQYDYPSAGLTTLTEKDGGEWVYAYDRSEGVLTAKVSPSGSVSTNTYYADGAFAGLAETRSEQLDEEPSGTDTIRTLYVTTTLSYDVNGNPLEVTGHARRLTIDAQGNLVGTVDDPADMHRSYTYGSYDRVTSISDLIAGTVATLDYVTDPGTGRETVTVTAPKINAADPSGPQTILVYTATGQLESMTDPLGRQVVYGYSAAGLLQTITDQTSGLATTLDDFDALGRPRTITQGAPNEAARVTHVTYDDLGRATALTRDGVAVDGNGDPLATYLTQFGYDLLGNRISVTDAENKTTFFDYNYLGQVTAITDALLQRTDLLYSGAGCGSCGGGVDKLIGVIDANHVTAPEPKPMTAFAYYASGKLKSETDPLGNTLLYAYDDGGRLTASYLDQNGNGEIDAATDQLLLSYTWLADGKLESKTDHLTGETTSFTYENGRLKTASNPAASYSFDYFDNGWLKSVDDGTTRVEYLYDAAGRRELATVKQGATVLQNLDYVYDAATKELKEIVSLAGTFGFTYDAWGRRSSLSYPNGVGATYSYHEDMDWLTGIDYAAIGLSLGYPLHDKVGNRKQRLEDGVATDYAFDATYQLTQAKTGAAEENFVYDAVGNRRAGPTVKEALDATYAHDDANRMLQGRKFAYAYDDRGNQTRRYLSADQSKRWEYTWDGENRLTEAKLIADAVTLRTVTFKYDPFGRRVRKVVSGQAPQVPVPLTTTYTYDGEDIVLQTVSDGTAATVTQYVHGPGIDEPLAIVTGGRSFFYHADGLGSIVAISDGAQNVVARYGYDAFGMVAASDPEFANAYAYTGREWDREIGLYYYRARYYDPMEGRFISKDPIGFAGGDWNVYRYVGNGALNGVDPSGLLTVNLWDYRGKNVAWGHASITLANGTHISWWPQGQNRQRNKLFNDLYRVDAFPNQTFMDDVTFEGQSPDKQIVINGLDESAIEQWWLNFKANNQWKTLSQNCSTTASDALKAGGAHVGWLDIGDRYNVAWTPADVENFVNAILNFQKSSQVP